MLVKNFIFSSTTMNEPPRIFNKSLFSFHPSPTKKMWTPQGPTPCSLSLLSRLVVIWWGFFDRDLDLNFRFKWCISSWWFQLSTQLKRQIGSFPADIKSNNPHLTGGEKEMVSKLDSFSSVKSVPPPKKKVLKFPDLTFPTLDSLTGQGRSPGCLGQGDEPPQPTTLKFGRFLFQIQNTMTMTQKHFRWIWSFFYLFNTVILSESSHGFGTCFYNRTLMYPG